jgi:hypothetical protein
VKHVIITVIRGMVPDEVADVLGGILLKQGVAANVIKLNPVSATYPGNRAVEVYDLGDVAPSAIVREENPVEWGEPALRKLIEQVLAEHGVYDDVQGEDACKNDYFREQEAKR